MATQLCYNRGCGREFKVKDNNEEACTFHPGAPYFHDAYKGWTCCQNKSTDFTTFLNTPGCSIGRHSNIKPLEPEKITGNLDKDCGGDEVVEVRPPIQPPMARPSVETERQRLIPTVAASLKQAMQNLKIPEKTGEQGNVKTGDCCKNNGCKETFPPSSEDCRHHPGYPVFHEGMKYWSCCQRKTSEFQHFLDQEGCEIGKHKWVDDKGKEIKCRYDWHQTASHVTLAVYAKKYEPNISYVELSPVRLVLHLHFPEDNANFDLDLELKGIVEVSSSSANMMGTKLEVKMKKSETGSWAKLDIPKKVDKVEKIEEAPKQEEVVDALDLDELDLTPTKMQLSAEAKMKVY